MTARHTRILLATDFDGTAATIEPGTTYATWHPGARSVFTEFAQHGEVALAIISGRERQELYAHTGGMWCYRAGSFGVEVDTPTGAALVRPAALRVTLPDWLTHGCIVRTGIVEQKPHGIALHWRSAGLPRQHRLIARFSAWAESAGLVLLDTRGVLEAVRPGASKVSALCRIAADYQATAVIFAGDDVPDVAAARWAATRGIGFFVTSDEVACPPTCVGVSNPTDLWRAIRHAIRSLLAAHM